MIKYPFGEADVIQLTASGDQDITIQNTSTIIDGVTVEATADRTLNLTIDSDLPAGSVVFIKSKTNGTEATIFGTNITGASITGVAGKTYGGTFVYDRSAFVQVATPVQID